MRNIVSLSIFVCVSVLFSSAKTVSFQTEKPAYQANIDWMWKEHSQPAQLRCTAYLIGAIPRGTASAHECVVRAIRAYRKDDMNTSLSWLKAGQCHNASARASISDAGQMACQYAEQEYGEHVGER